MKSIHLCAAEYSTMRNSIENSLRKLSAHLSIKMLSIAIAITLTSCLKPTQPNPSTSANPPTPATLRFSVQPTQDRLEQERIIAPLDAHLEKVLGQPVEFLIAKDYQDSVDMLFDGRANAAYIGAASYFEALERGAKVRPLVAPIDRYTARPWYRSCILVPANSPIKSLEDLKGKRVGFVSRSSTSGYLKPLAALRKLNIEPDRDFAQVIFGGTHDRTEALLGKQADAIATNLATYTRWKQQGKLTAQATRMLWQSDPSPHSPVLISENLPPELVEKLTEAFLTTPEGIQDLMGAETAGYTLVEEEDYESIQELRQQLKLTMEP
jgi:phosphonate transport system substrate-binding protein